MELSIQDLQELIGGTKTEIASHPYKLRQNYLIRTVTMIYTGRLVNVYKDELVLAKAAWIAETYRWYDTLTSGKLNEVEPYPDGPVIIGRGAILDVAEWLHPLPREQK